MVLTRREFLKGSIVAGTSLMLANCQTIEVPATTNVLRSFGLQQPWRNNGENAPFHTAMHAGYYVDEGLEVKLVEGGPGVNGTINVLAGTQGIEVGCIASIGSLITQRAEGMPVKATGALLQKHPFAYVALARTFPGKETLTPEDMRGKKVGIQQGADVYLEALLRSSGMTSEDVEKVIIMGEGPSDIEMGMVDFAAYWIINQPIGLTLKGIEWKAIMFSEWGMPLYADVIYSTDPRLEKDPQLMQAFLRATMRGVKRMQEDVDFAFEAVQKYGGGYDTSEKLRVRLDLQNEMAVSKDTDANVLGWMSEANVQQVIDWLHDTKQIREKPAVADIMTVEYLPALEEVVV